MTAPPCSRCEALRREMPDLPPDVGCSRCQPLEVNPAYVRFDEARQQAARERGPVVVSVKCARCGEKVGTLGTVYDHARWRLFYEARIVRALPRDDRARAREADLKNQTGQRVPPMVGLCRHLLDFPAEVPGPYFAPHRQEPPIAECPRCGTEEIPREVLKRAAAEGRRVVMVHQHAPPSM